MVHKPSICSLFLSGQYSWRVNDGDALEHRIRQVGTLETVKECVAELGQRTELFLGINHEGVAWHHAFRITMHHSYEAVSCRLRTNPQSGKILCRTHSPNYYTSYKQLLKNGHHEYKYIIYV